MLLVEEALLGPLQVLVGHPHAVLEDLELDAAVGGASRARATISPVSSSRHSKQRTRMLRRRRRSGCRMRAKAASPPAIRSKRGPRLRGVRRQTTERHRAAHFNVGLRPRNSTAGDASLLRAHFRRPLPVPLEKRLLLVRIDRDPTCGRVAQSPEEQHVEGVLRARRRSAAVGVTRKPNDQQLHVASASAACPGASCTGSAAGSSGPSPTMSDAPTA